MPKKVFSYQWGLGNILSSEAIPNSLPKHQNSPQHPPFGLYAEQLSGTSFTSPRATNRRSWLYRLFPSVKQGDYSPYKTDSFPCTPIPNPNPLRWDPPPFPNQPCHFLDGLQPLLMSRSPGGLAGAAVYLYAANQSMADQFFCNHDGEFLLVPETGDHLIETEFGSLCIEPNEIAVIPRGIKFQINLAASTSKIRGYILENYGNPLSLPELGPIGANGLANPRDFFYPQAAFHDQMGQNHLISKFQGQLWQCTIPYHPFNVVAWHGSYAPYGYNLTHFNTINTVSFDHPDPCIFTVLTSASSYIGHANVDFVIFPERWMVAEHTFRPPYFHRNVMSEYMGLIRGTYDAKGGDFQPGGGSLHNTMVPHGPDTDAYLAGTQATLKPEKQQDTLAFMFESGFPWLVISSKNNEQLLQRDYVKCWEKLPLQFKNPLG